MRGLRPHSLTVMELNPLYTSIKDMNKRLDALRGYL